MANFILILCLISGIACSVNLHSYTATEINYKVPCEIGTVAKSFEPTEVRQNQTVNETAWKDDVGFWKVSGQISGRYVTCILFQAALQFDVNYLQSDNTDYIARVNVPAIETTASGECGQRSQFINLQWPVYLDNGTSLDAAIRINIVDYYRDGNHSDSPTLPPPNTFSFSGIKITYPTAGLPDPKDPNEMIIAENITLDHFPTPLDQSYFCKYHELKSSRFTVRFAFIRYQAFMESPPKLAKFSKPVYCVLESEPVSFNDIVILIAVCFGYFSIIAFLFWHRNYKNYDDEDDEEDDSFDGDSDDE